MIAHENVTLRQGLERFYEEHKSQLSHNREEIPDEVRSFFMSHDVAHVLFGCEISLYGEGAVKIWTIFGTTLGFWNHLRAYKEANAFELSKRFNFAHGFKNFFKLLFSIPVIIIRAKRMNKLWPWSEYDSYLEMPISEIRKDFNIRILE